MANVTKIINPQGSIGINCDFNDIQSWIDYVCAQTNPDQTGLLQGLFSTETVSVTTCNFSTNTTQSICPKLVADVKWIKGSIGYGTQYPRDCIYI